MIGFGLDLMSIAVRQSGSISSAPIIADGGFDNPDPNTEWSRQDFSITLSKESGKLRLDLTSGARHAYQTFETEIGQSYTITADGELGTNVTSLQLHLRNGGNAGSFNSQSALLTSTGPISHTFTADLATTTLRLVVNTGSLTANAFFDNVVAVKN